MQRQATKGTADCDVRQRLQEILAVHQSAHPRPRQSASGAVVCSDGAPQTVCQRRCRMFGRPRSPSSTVHTMTLYGSPFRRERLSPVRGDCWRCRYGRDWGAISSDAPPVYSGRRRQIRAAFGVCHGSLGHVIADTGSGYRVPLPCSALLSPVLCPPLPCSRINGWLFD